MIRTSQGEKRHKNILFIPAQELQESKEKLARTAESSSSDTDEEGAATAVAATGGRKRKLGDTGDKPTEDVSIIFFQGKTSEFKI